MRALYQARIMAKIRKPTSTMATMAAICPALSCCMAGTGLAVDGARAPSVRMLPIAADAAAMRKMALSHTSQKRR
jgi:hypothetical protein